MNLDVCRGPRRRRYDILYIYTSDVAFQQRPTAEAQSESHTQLVALRSRRREVQLQARSRAGHSSARAHTTSRPTPTSEQTQTRDVIRHDRTPWCICDVVVCAALAYVAAAAFELFARAGHTRQCARQSQLPLFLRRSAPDRLCPPRRRRGCTSSRLHHRHAREAAVRAERKAGYLGPPPSCANTADCHTPGGVAWMDATASPAKEGR